MKKNKIKLIDKIDNKIKHAHYSLHNRKNFYYFNIIIFFVFIALLLLCGVMFSYAGVKIVNNEDVTPKQNTGEYILMVFGDFLFMLSCICYAIFNIYLAKRFNFTREQYFKTEDFKIAKTKILKQKVAYFTKKNIKWLKRMGYINTDEVNIYLSSQNQLKIECRNNKTKFSYIKPDKSL